MRTSLIITVLAAFLPLLLSSTCLTVDPPYPDRLSAPIFTTHKIESKVYDDEYNETVHLFWIPDSTDTISIVSFHILRQTAKDSFPKPLYTNIPSNVNDLYHPVYLLNFDLDDRNVDQLISYRIYAIDSLERPGDTSDIYLVELARTVTLLSPDDTLKSEIFKWEVPQILIGQTISHVILWGNDTTLWESDSIIEFTGGGPEIYEKTLPVSLSPLDPGKYYWGVYLVIVGGSTGKDASSINIRYFYVK